MVKWGKTEYLDVLGAWDWLIEKGWSEAQVGLMGNSMGGGTTTIAMAKEERVRAAWVDGGVCDVDEVLRDGIKRTVPMGDSLTAMCAADALALAQSWTSDSLSDTWPMDMASKVKPTQAMYFVSIGNTHRGAQGGRSPLTLTRP